jgi:transposase
MSDPREAKLLQEIAERDAKITALTRERQLLQERIDHLLKKIYGAKSEKVDVHHLQLLLQELHTPGPAMGNGSSPGAIEIEPPRRRKISGERRKPRLPEHLPVIEEIIVPEVVKAAPEQWRQIGEEISERLDYEPARFFKRRVVRPKYVRRGDPDAVPVTAPLPPCILEGSILTAGLLTQVTVAKYCDHLPLYRQESIYRSRHGVELSRQSMAQWIGVGADWLTLIYEQMAREIMSEGYVQFDETPVRYLAPGRGKTRTGYFWVALSPQRGAMFSWRTSRAAESLRSIVPVNFRGTMQCDGYTGYDAFARQHPEPIVLAGCWAHVRRKFVDAREHAPRAVALVLALMQNLYRLESHLRESRAGPKLRAIARQIEAQPIIERLKRTLLHWKQKKRFLPQSLMGKAIDYALGQWDSLLIYLGDGRVEIDTNLVENTIRPTAIGKKNWLFIGEAQAGDRSAIIYTIIENCRRCGIDPYTYLHDVFTRLPTATNQQIKDLTPAAWARTHRATALKRAA